MLEWKMACGNGHTLEFSWRNASCHETNGFKACIIFTTEFLSRLPQAELCQNRYISQPLLGLDSTFWKDRPIEVSFLFPRGDV